MKPGDDPTASDIMTRSLVTARPEQPLSEVELLMMERRISGLPVIEAGRLVGVVSRSDITRVQVLMQSLDGQVSDEQQVDEHTDGFQHTHLPDFLGFEQRLANLKVKDAMRHQVVTCGPSSRVSQIAADMVQQHIHRVIVVEGDRPVGIVSSLDIVRLLATVDAGK